MKSMLRTIITLLFFGGWALAAGALHVVRLNDGFVGLLPKDHLMLTDTYIDVRPWTPGDVAAHPDFIRRIVAADRSDWLKHVTDPAKGDVNAQLMEMLTPPPPTTAPAKQHGHAAASPGHR